MKMIDVLIKLANGEIKDQTTLKIHDPVNTLYTYTFNRKSKAFYSNSKYSEELSAYFEINDKFLNLEVELIPPKEKKYLVKFNMRGWKECFRYLNYYHGGNESIELNTKSCDGLTKTHFTKSELQSIKLVREFLEDMEGKYELIEVEEN